MASFIYLFIFIFLSLWTLAIASFIAIIVSEKFTRWWITFRNNMQGIETKITKQTIVLHRVSAVIELILSILMIVFMYFVFTS